MTQHSSPENELADRLYNFVKKNNGDWATAYPTLSWSDIDTIIGALRRPAQSAATDKAFSLLNWGALELTSDMREIWRDEVMRYLTELYAVTSTQAPAQSPLPDRETIAKAIHRRRYHLDAKDTDSMFDWYAEKPTGTDRSRMAIHSAFQDADAVLAALTSTDSRDMTPEERLAMERATAEVDAEANAILAARLPSTESPEPIPFPSVEAAKAYVEDSFTRPVGNSTENMDDGAA